MHELYADTCRTCGGNLDTIVLSGTENENIENAFNGLVQWVHAENKTTVLPDDILRAEAQSLTDAINGALSGGVEKEISQHMPDAMRAHFMDNIYVFSGCKTFDELQQVSGLLLDDNGNVKPFYKFFQDTRSIHGKYNKNYLKSEYQFATASARMAGKWADFEKYGDRYYLQYRTGQDDRVRAEHEKLHNTTLPINDPFWDKYTPPNGWRCRCGVWQVLKNRYEPSDSEEASKKGELATETFGKGGVNTSAMFRFNPGKQKTIFPPTHPYFNNKEVVKKVKGAKPAKPGDTSKKEKQIIDLNEYIKGNEPTAKEVDNIIRKYAELKPDDFAHGLEEVKITSSKSYFMQHSMAYNPYTKQWVGKATINISSYNHPGYFKPSQEIKAALGAIKRGEKLTFNQEYSIESLWHEILHGKTKSGVFDLSVDKLRVMETVNQFCARHTYDQFLARLGGTAAHKEKILSDGYGYSNSVSKFRQRLKECGITEKKALKELMPKLLDNYNTIPEETEKFILDNTKKKKK